MNEAEVYIRPCGAMPDGYEIPKGLVPELRMRNLIVPDEQWAGDYAAYYSPWDDEDRDRVAESIEEAVRRYKARHGGRS